MHCFEIYSSLLSFQNSFLQIPFVLWLWIGKTIEPVRHVVWLSGQLQGQAKLPRIQAKIKNNRKHHIELCYINKSWKRSLCEELTPHALYMRLKRLCQRSNTGKLKVDEAIHSEWLQGDRDTLSLALVKALKTCGFESNAKTRKSVQARKVNKLLFLIKWSYFICYFIGSNKYDCFDTAVQAEFEKQVFKIKEQQRAREEEIEGGWYTEERMGKDLGYSPMLEHAYISYKLSYCFLEVTIFYNGSIFLSKSFSCFFCTLLIELRALIGKVKSYCLRFRSVLVRTGDVFH